MAPTRTSSAGPSAAPIDTLELQHRNNNVVMEDDVRRFACDRCRSQKLRCERTQVSLKIPLKQIPCKRCIRMGIRCTTNPQVRPGDSVRRLTRRPNARNIATFDAQHDDSTESDDQEDTTGINGERDMMDVDFQPNDIRGAKVAAMPDTASTAYPSPNPMRMQTMPVSTSHGVAQRGLYSPQFNLNPLPTPARSETNPLPNQDFQMAQMLQDYVTVPGEDNGQNLDPDLFQDSNFDISGGFTSTQDSETYDGSSKETFGLGPVAMSVDGRQSRAMLSVYNPSAQRQQYAQQAGPRRQQNDGIAVARPRTAPSAPPLTLTQPRMPLVQQNSKSVTHLSLAQKCSVLTNGILEDMSGHSNVHLDNTMQPDQQNDAVSAELPLQKLLARLNELVMLIDEAPLAERPRQASADDLAYNPQPPNPIMGRPEHVRSQSAHEMPHEALLGGDHDNNLARLSFMTALTSCYTTTLQAYHHVFTFIQESCVTIEDLALHLPLFQLGGEGAKYAISRQTRVHLTLEMALQELNRLENKLKQLIPEYQTSEREAEICSLAVLSSLMEDDGGAASASACVRGTIDALRRAFVVERK